MEILECWYCGEYDINYNIETEKPYLDHSNMCQQCADILDCLDDIRIWSSKVNELSDLEKTRRKKSEGIYLEYLDDTLVIYSYIKSTFKNPYYSLFTYRGIDGRLFQIKINNCIYLSDNVRCGYEIPLGFQETLVVSKTELIWQNIYECCDRKDKVYNIEHKFPWLTYYKICSECEKQVDILESYRLLKTPNKFLTPIEIEFESQLKNIEMTIENGTLKVGDVSITSFNAVREFLRRLPLYGEEE